MGEDSRETAVVIGFGESWKPFGDDLRVIALAVAVEPKPGPAAPP